MYNTRDNLKLKHKFLEILGNGLRTPPDSIISNIN